MKQRVVLASGNAGKLREITHLLADSNFECLAPAVFGLPEVAEDGFTFVENALKKARSACRHTGLAAIADDSGLEVDALGSSPGIHSARFAGPNASDAENTALLLEKMKPFGGGQRGARFVCVMVFMRHVFDPVPVICTGIWRGEILTAPRGANGFGYDPVFLPMGSSISAAEMSAEQKYAVSHRAKALACLAEQMTRGID
jgi:XTP/dITP diphosphohydrolase